MRRAELPKYLLVLGVLLLSIAGRAQQVQGIAAWIDMVANLLLIIAALEWLRGELDINVRAPIEFDANNKPIKYGVLRMSRRAASNISMLTNAFSKEFFDGNQMPGQTRAALIDHTLEGVIKDARRVRP